MTHQAQAGQDGQIRSAPSLGLRAINLANGLAPALACKMLAETGIDVAHLETRPDATLEALYPAMQVWKRGEFNVHLEDVELALETADICILGGEPGRADGSLWTSEDLRVRFPRLVVLSLGSGMEGVPAIDLLVQAATGAVFEQVEGRPVALAFPAAAYGCALQAVLGVWIALIERESSGRGQAVATSLAAGLAMFWGPFWMKAERPPWDFDHVTPKGARQLLLRSRDNQIIQIVMGVPGAVAGVHAALGMPPPLDVSDRGLPDAARGAANFFGDIDRYNRFACRLDADEILATLATQGVPAERVRSPVEAWSDPQISSAGLLRKDQDGWTRVGSPMSWAWEQPRRSDDADLVSRPHRPFPLSGLKVVDFGRFVAGPYASKLLADYGAEVTAIVAPQGRPTLSGGRTVASVYLGKRLVELDAKSISQRPEIDRLCAEADIVTNNFRNGVASRLGIAPSDLRRLNPHVITLATTAYGPSGPKAGAPGFDMTIQALCGLQSRNGGEDNGPICSRSPLVDFATGAFGAIGILVAVFTQRKTGRSGDVETSLLNVGLHMMSELVRDPEGQFRGAKANSYGLGVQPAESLYQTADGWIALAVRSEAMAAALADHLDLDLPATPSVWSVREREILKDRIRGWSTERLLVSLKQAEVHAAPCVLDGWTAEPAQGPVFREIEDPEYGRIRHCIGPLVTFSRSSGFEHKRLDMTSAHLPGTHPPT